MAIVRSYVDDDWHAVFEICMLAFTPIYESFAGLLGMELFLLVYPDWRASNEKYLRSLSESGEKKRLYVAEEDGTVVGFIHFTLDVEKSCGRIGFNAVHPAHQGDGIESLMYRYVLDIMREHGLNYARVDTGGDESHAPARRAYEKAGFLPLPVIHYFKNLKIE